MKSTNISLVFELDKINQFFQTIKDTKVKKSHKSS